MAKQFYTLSLDSIKLLTGLIRDLASVSEGIDNLHLADDKTFSNIHIKNLIDKCLQDANAEAQKLVGALTHLTCEETTVQPTLDNSEINVIYLYSADGNAPYQQYLKISDTKLVDLGSTSISLTNYLTSTEIARDYVSKLNFDALKTTVDKKVDKADIVDNLTSTDTDKPLSANQGKVLKDEVDLKANDSDVVKKTDIVTTIDNTSTDDTIPSTKAVYDKINPIVIKSISTSYDSDTIENYLETITPNTDVLFVSNSTTGELVTLTGQHLFLIEYRKVANLFLQRAYQARDGKLIACRSKNWWNNTWSKWQKVCTTSVADVARKTITNPSNVTSGTISYAISNGICSVEIIGITPDGTGGVTIPLPKSLYYTVGLLVDPTGTPVGSACGGTNGAFNIIDISGTTALYGGFSYSVAES